MKLAIRVSWLILTLLCSPIHTTPKNLVGVAPSQKPHYDPSSGDFMCIDFSESIPFSRVNDNFCDCSDGSDEPGTSACPNGEFHCINAGFRHTKIPSRLVNDGFCDCCDGSDEYKSPSGLLCPDTCLQMGREERERVKRDESVHQEGFRSKLEFIQMAAQKREEKERELRSLREEIESTSGTVHKLEQGKIEAETAANGAKEKHEEKVEAAKLEAKIKRIGETFTSMDTDNNGVITVEELAVRSELDTNGDGSADKSELEMVFGDELQDGVTLGELSTRWDEYKSVNNASKNRRDELINAAKSSNETRVPNPAPEYDSEDPGDLPQEESEYDSQEDYRGEDVPTDNSDSEDVVIDYDQETESLIQIADEKKHAYDDAKKSQDEINNKIKSVEEFLQLDLGPDHEFYPISESCYTKDDREYTYELCPFKKVLQRPKAGGRETSLGLWSEWDHSMFRYGMMVFNKGERCWSGPERNTRVTVLCGKDSELISVDEPSRCEYAFEFRTPAACQASLADSRLHKFHDEL